jgi:S-sulfo-L-cysteine synthase (O-acetyl-L-serine-dependent)
MQSPQSPVKYSFNGHSLLSLIGNTPLVRIKKIADDFGIDDRVEVYGKCEFLNPGGSVKDRPALNIIETAEAQGLLSTNKILLDATSGNTGIAYAMICAAKNYKVRLCVPESASPERKKILTAYGAEIIYTPRSDSSDGAIRKAQQLYAENPDAYFYADQYGNDANWQAHFNSTGVEIWEQTEHRVSHFVAAIGTSGTFIGTSRRLKIYNSDIECVAVQPDVAIHGLEGVKHLESALVPKIYDASVVDEFSEVSTEAAYSMVKKLASVEGLLLGVSAAANVQAALRVAKALSEQGKTGVVVTILCDGALKYLSERFWDG